MARVTGRRAWRGPRRGLALLAALWLVVLITTAGAQFAMVARERRALGLSVTDQARDIAAIEGGLALLQAQLETAGRQANGIPGARARRSVRQPEVDRVDPWRNAERRLTGDIAVAEQTVHAEALDLGTVLNVNLADEQSLRTLFGALIRDALTADRLAQAIADWRDVDTLPRVNGAEVAAYRLARRAVLPANGAFRTLDDLANVLGMTPELLQRLRPYLTTDGFTTRVNLNAAPEPILRTLPGMTPPVLASVLALRSAGRRVESVLALATAVRSPGRGNDVARAEFQALVREWEERTTLTTRDVAFTLTVPRPGRASAALVAVLRRGDDGSADIRWRRW